MELKDKIEIARHSELLKAMNSVTSAIQDLPKDDGELKKILSENKEAINNFTKTINGLTSQKSPDVKVETNQDKVVSAINDLGKIMEGMSKRLELLEVKEKPVPSKLKAVYQYDRIDYVIIEYKK